MRNSVLILVCATACCCAAGPAYSQSVAEAPRTADKEQAPADGKVTSAAEIRAMFHDGLIKRGIPAPIAALLTADTEVVSEDAEHLHFVQTLIGGGRREVKLTLKAVEQDKTPRVALMLDEGQVVLAESVEAKAVDGGYQANLAVYVPAESVPLELQPSPKLGQATPAWLEWVGIGDTLAQAPGSGLAVSVSDGFSSGSPTSTSGTTMQSLVQAAEQTFSGQTIEFVKTAQEVSSMIGPQVEGPKTLWQQRTDNVKAGAEVFEQGAKVYDMLKQDDVMRQKLRALKDCAENPTEPTAIDAQRTDPNYRRATTEVIEDAERNLKLNTFIRIFASSANAIAGTLLSAAGGPGKAKAVSLIDGAEDKLMQYVAEEYIMKDAGKGVVPCRTFCGPVYSPPPPSQQQASHPPAEMSCAQPQPEALVCQAAPASSGANSSQPTPPPPTPPPAGTCGVLTRADFTYTYNYASSGCTAYMCGSSTKQVRYSGSASLSPDRNRGYTGRGPGMYRSADYSEERVKGVACASKHGSLTSAGPADLIVNAYFSIANSVTGGIDTGGMSADTSVVEILTEGDQVAMQQTWVSGCDPEQSSTGTNSVGFDCHFYGVDLYRTGYYRVFKNNEPESGICTLSLSR